MKGNRLRGAIVDSGFWFALFNPNDRHHAEAVALENKVLSRALLIPWPVLYEVVNSHLVAKPAWCIRFQKILSSQQVRIVDDRSHRELALDESMRLATSGRRRLSLVDVVIRSILSDMEDFMVTHLVTFNARDFADVCNRKSIPIEP